MDKRKGLHERIWWTTMIQRSGEPCHLHHSVPAPHSWLTSWKWCGVYYTHAHTLLKSHTHKPYLYVPLAHKTYLYSVQPSSTIWTTNNTKCISHTVTNFVCTLTQTTLKEVNPISQNMGCSTQLYTLYGTNVRYIKLVYWTFRSTTVFGLHKFQDYSNTAMIGCWGI